jgi:hypothetical protein
VIPPVAPPPLDDLSSGIPLPDPPANTRILRPRTTPPTTSTSLIPVPRPRIPVAQRWTYVPVPEPRPYTLLCDIASAMPLVRLDASAAFLASPLDRVSLSIRVPPSGSRDLRPRQAWMLEDDLRSDADADSGWHAANARLFGTTFPMPN